MEGLITLQEDPMDMPIEKEYPHTENVTRLFQSYSDEILRMCYLYLKDYQLAEDALQETFIRVTKSINQFQGNSSEKTWLIRIAINVCKTMLHTKKSQSVDFSIDASYLIVRTADEINQLIEKSIVSQAIMKLDTPYREVIILHYYQELKLREIPKITGEKMTTVAYRLRQGKKLLKESLSSLR
jgi:RNA polymerase sigma factor, sigma-70 family